MEPIIHYLIPLVILLAVFPKTNKKLAFSLAVLTWIIDLDYFTPMHRLLTHNLLFLILVSAIFYFAMNKQAMYMAAYFISSHLILDSAYPGNALFWPLYNKGVYLIAEVNTNLMINFKIGVVDLISRQRGISQYIATEGILILLLLAILLLVKYKDRILKR